MIKLTYELKEEYQKVFDHLSDDDKVIECIENYNFNVLRDVVLHYDLQDNFLLEVLALEEYGQDPRYAYRYAQEVIQGRWLEVEDVIKTDPQCAYLYADFVLEDRWIEAEPYIKTDPKHAYLYADQVIKGRFPEAEDVIKTDSHLAHLYATWVMNDENFWDKN